MKSKLLTFLTICLTGTCLLAGCSREKPVTSVDAFMRNDVLLEATLVRCTQNRSETRYEPDCINVREAVKIIEAREEKARREQLELQSQRKREALRRTQEAVAEARRRAAEEQRRRDEAEYMAQFGEVPPGAAELEDAALTGNAPTASITEAQPDDPEALDRDSLPAPPDQAVQENTQVADTDSAADGLSAVRDELKRRNDDGNE